MAKVISCEEQHNFILELSGSDEFDLLEHAKLSESDIRSTLEKAINIGLVDIANLNFLTSKYRS